MLIKGKISKKLEGSICIPTISQKAMIANTEFEIDEQQFWKADVQRALQLKKIVFTTKTPSNSSKVVVTNISEGSITVSGHGIVRTGASVRISKDDAKKRDILKMFEDGKVSLDGKRKRGAKKDKKPPEESTAVIIDKRKKKKKSDDFNPITWSPNADDAFVEGLAPEKEDDSEIQWVDAEQKNEKIKSHPVLSKKYAKNSNRKGKSKSKKD